MTVGYCEICKRSDADLYEQASGVHNTECTSCHPFYDAIKEYARGRSDANRREAQRRAISEIMRPKLIDEAVPEAVSNAYGRILRSLANHAGRQGGSLLKALSMIRELIDGTEGDDTSGLDVMSVPMLFLRVGWMKFYEGQTATDRIHGGGEFVREHGFGHEMFNFLSVGDWVFGYARPVRGLGDMDDGAGINLKRISKSAGGNELNNVLVVWVSSPPTGGTYIVGWYRNATVYRQVQPPPDDPRRTFQGKAFNFYVSARAENMQLLETTARVFSIPRKKGFIGQSNVWYADDPEQNREFRREVLTYIETRQLPSYDSRTTGVSRQPDSLRRTEVERAAVKYVTAHFEGQNYNVDSREDDNLGYDLIATCGTRELQLEVKGLSGDALCVDLTPNEYRQMHAARDSYYLCVVTQALSTPRLSVFGFSPDTRTWQDDCKRVLKLQEIVAARCSVE